MPYDSPYEALGEQGVRSLVDEFYRIMDTSQDYKEIRAMHAEDLEPIKDKLGDYLIGWMGGPQLSLQKYGSVCMTNPHTGFYIGPRERDSWISCMQEAMLSLEISNEIQTMLLGPLYRLADAVKNRQVDKVY